MREVIGKNGWRGELEEYQQRRKEYNSRRLKNELKRAVDKTNKEYFEIMMCDKIMEFQRTGCYYVWRQRNEVGKKITGF